MNFLIEEVWRFQVSWGCCLTPVARDPAAPEGKWRDFLHFNRSEIASGSNPPWKQNKTLGHNGFEPVMEELGMRRDLLLPLPDRPMPPDATITTWQLALADQFFQAYEASFRERLGFPGWSASEWIAGRVEDDNARPEWSLRS